ncbi:hypothetical protein [Janthinobacterium sp. RB2R34]|uniref:hypothetical protein n=1 Tax=Janthinobacterium sp. RB2R34 TaxID=3424193 RepID=UPI003F265EC2
MYPTPAKALFTCVLLFATNFAQAQSSQMADPDVLGMKLGMKRSEAMALIKSKFPGSRTTATQREVMLGDADLLYDAQLKIVITQKNQANVEQDVLTLVFLPDDTLLGIRRQLRYVPQKQKSFDLDNTLTAKYGNPVYYVSDHNSRFANQSMWSNTMLPGLSLVGTQYVQGGTTRLTDFGTTAPYPECWGQMLSYLGEQFDPRQMYYQLTDRSGFALNRAKQWKACGKALWVENNLDHKLYYNLTQTDLMLMDLARAPDAILAMPQMLKENTKTTYTIPATEVPKVSAGTPSF